MLDFEREREWAMTHYPNLGGVNLLNKVEPHKAKPTPHIPPTSVPVGMQRFERRAKRAIARKEVSNDFHRRAGEALALIKEGRSIPNARSETPVQMERFLGTLAQLISKDAEAPHIVGVLLAEESGLLTFANGARIGFVIAGMAHKPNKPNAEPSPLILPEDISLYLPS